MPVKSVNSSMISRSSVSGNVKKSSIGKPTAHTQTKSQIAAAAVLDTHSKRYRLSNIRAARVPSSRVDLATDDGLDAIADYRTNNNMNLDDEATQSEAMTREEQLIYDRQIRAWGHEAQRDFKAQTFVALGQSQFTIELAKNLILTGFGAVYVACGAGRTELVPLAELNKYCKVYEARDCKIQTQNGQETKIAFQLFPQVKIAGAEDDNPEDMQALASVQNGGNNNSEENNDSNSNKNDDSNKNTTSEDQIQALNITRNSIYIIDVDLMFYNLFVEHKDIMGIKANCEDIRALDGKISRDPQIAAHVILSIVKTWLIRSFSRLGIAECIQNDDKVDIQSIAIKSEPLIYLKYSSFEVNEAKPDEFNELIAADSVKVRRINLVRVLISGLSKTSLADLEELSDFSSRNLELSKKFVELENLQSVGSTAKIFEARMGGFPYFDPLTPIFAADMATYSIIDMIKNGEKRGLLKKFTMEISSNGWKVKEQKYK